MGGTAGISLFPPSLSEMGSQSSDTFDSMNQPSLPGTPGIFVGPAAIVPVGLNDSIEEMRSPMSQSSSQISQISAIPMDISTSQMSSTDVDIADAGAGVTGQQDYPDSSELSEVSCPSISVSAQSQRDVLLLSHHWSLATRNGGQNSSVAGVNSWHGFGVRGLESIAEFLPSSFDNLGQNRL